MITAVNRTVLILDALDECHEKARSYLLSKFESLVGCGLPVKVLISSRRNYDIMAILKNESNIKIEATDNQRDIETFIASSIALRDKRLPPQISPGLEKSIIETFMARSNGMYVHS